MLPGNALLLIAADGPDHLLIIPGDDLLEVQDLPVKIVQDLLSPFGTGGMYIIGQDFFQFLNIVFIPELLQLDHVFVDPAVEAVVPVQDIGDAAAHAGREVLARGAKKHRSAACHIFQAVVAAAFRHSGGAGVPDTETLTGHAANIGCAGSRPVQGHVADDTVFRSFEPAAFRRAHDQPASRESLAEAVIGVSPELNGQAAGDESPEGLAAAAFAMNQEAVRGQVFAAAAVFSDDFRTQDGPESPVRRADVYVDGSTVFPFLYGLLEPGQEEPFVRCLFQAEIIAAAGVETVVLFMGEAGCQNLVKSNGPRVGLSEFFPFPQAVCPADHLVYGPESQRCHDFAQLHGRESHKVHQVLGLSGKTGTQALVLGGNADGTGIFGTYPHHHAAQRDQRCGGKTILFRSQECRNGHVPACHQLAVSLDPDPGTQAAADQGLMGLGDAQLPGESGAVDRAVRCRACAAVIAGDQDHLGAGFGNAGGNGTDACFRNQLDGYAGPAVGILQIIDQLGQIFDGIDVMVGRRGDQLDAGRRTSGGRHPGIDFGRREVSAFTGLSPLGHFDLNLFRAQQVLLRNAETAGSHLLDRAVPVCPQPVGSFTAFPCIGTAAQAVHGQGNGLMGLPGQGTVAHGTGLETADDLFDRFHLVKIDRISRRNKFQQAPQGVRMCRVIDQGSVLTEFVIVSGPDGLLQKDDDLRTVEVILFAGAASQVMEAQAVQHRIYRQAHGIEGPVMPVGNAFLQLPDADPADPAGDTGKVFVDHFIRQAYGLEDPCGLVGLYGGNAHLGGDLNDASQQGSVIIVDGCVQVFVQQAQGNQFFDTFVGQVGIDSPDTETQDTGCLMDIPDLPAFQNQGDCCPFSGMDQMLLYGGNRQQGRNGDMVLINASVGEDNDIGPFGYSPVDRQVQVVDGFGKGGMFVIKEGYGRCPEPPVLHGFDLHQIHACQDGVVDFQDRAVFTLFLQQVAVRAYVHGSIRHDLFPQGIDGRVGDLGELLLEEPVQQGIVIGKSRQGNVMAHGYRRLRAAGRGFQDVGPDFFIAVAEDLVESVPLRLAVDRHLAVGDGQLPEMDQVGVQPFPVRIGGGIKFFGFLIGYDPFSLRIDQEHPAGRESCFFYDPGRIDIQYADL